jgi:Tol biopolymer transport system component
MGGPRFSPDGKWIAYRSGGEVFVQDFPAARTRIQISNQGGGGPVWRPDMKELFYTRNSTLMSVEVRSTGSGLEFGVPHELFTSSILKNSQSSCDATPDGQRFLCLAPAPSNPLDDQLTILLNWRAGLR